MEEEQNMPPDPVLDLPTVVADAPSTQSQLSPIESLPADLPVEASAATESVALDEPPAAAIKPTPVLARPRQPFNWQALFGLLGVLLLAGYLRFNGLNWDEFQHVHPDERFLTMVESALELPKSFSEYMDSDLSPLNPANRGYTFFVYGNAPITIVRYVAEWSKGLRSFIEQRLENPDDLQWRVNLIGTREKPGPYFWLTYMGTGYDEVHLVGRFMSGLFDLGAVFLAFLLGRRLYGWRVGLLASLFGALAVAQIQQSHFWTVDSFSTFFVTLALYFAARALDSDDWLNYVGFGFGLGMSVASKINTAPLAMAITIVAVVRYLRLSPKERDAHFSPLLVRLLCAAFVSFLVFRVAQPYSFAGSQSGGGLFSLKFDARWQNSMQQIQGQISGNADFPPNHQWANRPAIIFPLENMVKWGLGWGLGISVWLGLILAGLDSLVALAFGRQQRWQRHLVLLTWVGFYFVWQGTQWVKPIRYFLPLYPSLAVFGAWLWVTLICWARRSQPAEQYPHELELQRVLGWLLTLRDWLNARLTPLVRQIIVGVGFAAVLLYTVAWAFAFQSIYSRPQPLVAASRWIFSNVPSPYNIKYQAADGQTYSQPLAVPLNFQITANQPNNQFFSTTHDGNITALQLSKLTDPLNDGQAKTVLLEIARTADPATILASAKINFASTDTVLVGETAQLSQPVAVVKGEQLLIQARLETGQVLALSPIGIANETGWDLGLPFRMDGYDPFNPGSPMYNGYNFEMYYEDNATGMNCFNDGTMLATKRECMLAILDRTDYIFISSNRQFASLERIPTRFPVSLAYYDALFSGKLGFEAVKVIENAPQLGPWVRSDQLAEEPFTVYEHPKAFIFRKSASYSAENARTILNAVDTNKIVTLNAFQATKAPTALLFTAARWAAQQAGGTWSANFNPESLINSNQVVTVIVWYLTVLLLGWVAFPLLFTGLSGLADRGYAASKAAALLCIAWLSWFLASFQILPFTSTVLWGCAVLLLFLAAGLAFLQRQALLVWLRDNRGYILSTELLFLVLFCGFLAVRYHNPDLWHPSYGGEKPMDFAYFNGVIRSTSFPAIDPWFAGGYLNYYYFGFVIVATITKMLGVLPQIAYNLILPMLFGMAGIGAYCGAYNLAHYGLTQKHSNSRANKKSIAISAAILAALLMVVLGNLGQPDTFVRGWQRVVGKENPSGGWVEGLKVAWQGFQLNRQQGTPLPIGTGSWYWDATRIIPFDSATDGAGPISEFPFFTFLYGDLHAHMMVLPVALLAILWALNAALRPIDHTRKWWQEVVTWGLGGLFIGAVAPTNASDGPTYLLLAVVAVAYWGWRAGQQLGWLQIIFGIVWRVVLTVAIGKVLFRPYDQWYGFGYGDLEPWSGSRTVLSAYLKVHGLFLFVLISFLWMELRHWLKSTTLHQIANQRQWLVMLLALGAGLVVLGVILAIPLEFHVGDKLAKLSTPIAPLVLGLVALVAFLMLVPNQTSEKRAILALFGLGLLLTLVVELVRISGDIGRMNMVFKFYLQVWTMFSVAAGGALGLLFASLPNWGSGKRLAWEGSLVALILVALLYTTTAAKAKMSDRMVMNAPHTLDGDAYMALASYGDFGRQIPLVGDAKAIRWMQLNVQGSPVIVEAQHVEYRWGSRFSINTGLPAVVGWNWHQRQQRAIAGDRLVYNRVDDVRLFYNTPDPNLKANFLKKYDVRYVILGEYEQSLYEQPGLQAFTQLVDEKILTVAYQADNTTIYQVDAAALQALVAQTQAVNGGATP